MKMMMMYLAGLLWNESDGGLAEGVSDRLANGLSARFESPCTWLDCFEMNLIEG